MRTDTSERVDQRGRNGLRGPIKESRRLRITISHRENMIARRQAELDALRADKECLEAELARVLKIEAAVAG